MAQLSNEPLKHKYWYATLIVVLLLVFFALYNRTYFFPQWYPEKQPLQTNTIDRRLNDWNLSHVDSALKLAKHGDIVAIHEVGELSNNFRFYNKRNSLYAYLGIIMLEKGVPIVYYAAGNKQNPNQPLQRDSLKHFIYPNHVVNFGIYRFDMNRKQVAQLENSVRDAYKNELPFDPQFDLEEDSLMYNTEFVYKMYRQVLADSITNFTTSDLLGKPYIACDDVILSKNLKMICRIKYSR